jgi:hypothetical protein
VPDVAGQVDNRHATAAELAFEYIAAEESFGKCRWHVSQDTSL